MQLLRPPARGGINAGGGPCVAFISSKGCRMGKSRPPTAGSDPISISPTGLGPNWDIPACLSRAAGWGGVKDAGGEGVEGGGSQLRVERGWKAAAGWGAGLGEPSEGGRSWGSGQGPRTGRICRGGGIMETGWDGTVPYFEAQGVRYGDPTPIPHGVDGDGSRPGGKPGRAAYGVCGGSASPEWELHPQKAASASTFHPAKMSSAFWAKSCKEAGRP